MMLPGTPGAHIMIPINPPAKTSTVTDSRGRRDRAGDAAAARGSRAPSASVYQLRREDRRAHRGCARAPTSPSARRAAPTASPGATTARPPQRRDFSARSCARRASPTRRLSRRSPRRPRTARSSRRRSGRCRIAVRQDGSDSAAVGAVGARRDARDGRRLRKAASATKRSAATAARG